MAKLVKITGMPQVLKKLLGSTKTIRLNIGRGLRKGGKYLQGKSQDIVPVQLGNLKNAAFTRDVGVTSPDVIVGYAGVDYAVYVHEDMEKAHGQAFNIKHAEAIARATPRQRTAQGGLFNRGENQQAKFLEKPARDERGEILRIVHREARF